MKKFFYFGKSIKPLCAIQSRFCLINFPGFVISTLSRQDRTKESRERCQWQQQTIFLLLIQHSSFYFSCFVNSEILINWQKNRAERLSHEIRISRNFINLICTSLDYSELAMLSSILVWVTSQVQLSLAAYKSKARILDQTNISEFNLPFFVSYHWVHTKIVKYICWERNKTQVICVTHRVLNPNASEL